MPFISIELSQNVVFELEPFAKSLHEYLAPLLDVAIEKFKSKKVVVSDFFLGMTASFECGYARFRLELMSGRDREKLKAILNELLQRFRSAILEQNPQLQCRITAEIAELDREFLLAGHIVHNN